MAALGVGAPPDWEGFLSCQLALEVASRKKRVGAWYWNQLSGGIPGSRTALEVFAEASAIGEEALPDLADTEAALQAIARQTANHLSKIVVYSGADSTP